MISTFTDSVRPPYGFVSYPEGMNGAGYPFPNPAAAAAAAAASAGLGVHNTPALDAHSVPHSTPHSQQPHSTLSESAALHLVKPESTDVH
jgi:hypothetical protein